jgi:hypothetical protein
LFKTLREKIDEAKNNEVHFYAPQNYRQALEIYESALSDFREEAKLSEINTKIKNASDLLDLAFETTRISKVALEELVETRKRIQKFEYNRYAPNEIAQSIDDEHVII